MKNGMNAVSFVMLVVALLATASISWAAGGYQYNLGCNGCHGNPPLDTTDKSRNIDTGGFAGNHATHTVANKCDVCHAGTINPSAYVSGHSDGKIQMFSKYAKGTFFNQTSVPNLTIATCATVNCHFETTTPTWGSAMPATPADCNLCHNTPPNTGVSGNSHSTHSKYTPAWVNPNGSLGLACTPCHTDGGVNGVATTTYQHATSAGNRPIHFDSTLNYIGSNGKFLPSQAASRLLGSCSNTYCHSNGVQGAGNVTVATPVWGTTTTCASCHAAKPVTNGHAVHVTNYNYNCDYCHVKTVTTDPTTGISTINTTTGYQMHTNKVVNVDFGGIAGSGTGTASCSTTYCHNSLAFGLPATNPVWTNAASVVCGSCHYAANTAFGAASSAKGRYTNRAHTVHLNTAVQYGPIALQNTGAAVSCQVCHTNYPTTHAKGVVDVTTTACNPCHVVVLNASTTHGYWNGGRVTCESCHASTATPPVLSKINNVTAADKTLNSTQGHGQFANSKDCTICHNANASHIGNTTVHTPRLKAAYTSNDNSVCADCHNNATTVPTASFRNMSTHFTALGVANELCKKCHDPHGTRNIFMLRTTLSGVNGLGRVHLTITDASTGFVNSAGSGICQLCHTKTKYYLAGIPETAHPDRDCLSCHRHNAKGGAFKPSGTCDGCHGYPPVPTGLANFTFGTTGNYANAKFQDYSGGGGAHAIAAHVSPNAVPADGWKNCAMCHNGGSINNPSHITKMPIKTNIANVTVKLDQKLRFNNTVQVTYSSAHLVYPNNQTGTCNNVECHFKPSPRWSIQR